jgi:hypothetical protein
MARTRTQLAWLGLCAWLAQGCSLTFSDIDDYEQGAPAPDAGTDAGGQSGPPRCGDGRSMCVELVAFDPHVDELLVLSLAAGGVTRGRAILDPFFIEDVEAHDDAGATLIALNNALVGSEPPYSVRFFADHDINQDRVYTPPPSDSPDAPFPDHAWVVDLEDDGTLEFEHAVNFIDLDKDPPRELEGDFRLTVRGMTSHPGMPLYVWVIWLRDPERTVGFYRLGAIPEQLCSPTEGASCTEEMQNPFTIEIPGILDDGEAYRVELLVDKENLGVFDSPPTDHSWIIETIEADRNGIDAEFVHNSDFVDISPVPQL